MSVQERIAIIPIRSGSKGLPDKNVRMLCGRPLVAHTILCAKRSGRFDKIFVSTDSEEYAKIAAQYGADVPFLRSAETSTDTAGSWDVVREVIGRLEGKGERYDEIMLLQATSPLREPEDIAGSIDLLRQRGASAVISVTEMEHPPVWANTLPPDLRMDDFFTEGSELPRQQIPTYYRLNGAIYLLKRELLDRPDSEMFRKDCYAYIMPRERSVDIDTAFDLKVAELYLRERQDDR